MKKLQTILFALMMITMSLAGCLDENSIDLDDDGISDADDLCPDTDAGLSVDTDGCADNQLDDDADLVMNDVDLCPDTDTGATVDANGCAVNQLDDDGDGIMNDVDLCPNTPVGETVDTDGCSTSQTDADGDGVMDSDDLCPNTPAGETVHSDGCSASQTDTDGDGVMDSDDLCPNTPAGTTVDATGCIPNGILIDIYPGATGNTSRILGTINSEIYFVGYDADYGHELWKSDGTEAGTVLVKDTISGPDPGSHNPFFQSVIMGDELYFFTDLCWGCNTGKLWKSDGTASGTITLNSGVTFQTISSMVATTDKVFFSDWGSLWVYDSTGLHQMEDIDGNILNYGISSLIVGGDSVYFSADDGVHGRELWISDGTDVGTYMVKDISQEPSSVSTSVNGMIHVGDYLYFPANDGTDYGYWRTDGTDSGTVAMSSVVPSFTFWPTYVQSLVNFNGELVFVYNLPDNGNWDIAIWKYDPLTETVSQLIEIAQDEPSALSYVARAIGNGNLYYCFDQVLFSTDGSTTGSSQHSLNEPCDSGALLYGQTKLFFISNSDLYSFDPSTSVTSLEMDFEDWWRTPAMALLGPYIYVSGDDGVHGIELHRFVA